MAKWVWSTSEERYSSDFHETREAALAEGRDYDPDETIFTGRVKAIPPAQVSPYAYHLVELTGERLWDEVGEAAEVFEATTEQTEDLQSRLDAAFSAWIEEHAIVLPYRVVDIEAHPAPTEEEEPTDE